MVSDDSRQRLLRKLPGVDRLIETAGSDLFFGEVPRSVIVNSARRVVEAIRAGILDGDADGEKCEMAYVMAELRRAVATAQSPNLKPLVNATGVVVHTNLGRSLLADDAIANLATVAAGYSNLEYNLSAGRRGIRYGAVEDLICELCGAESAMAVNNNAGAVLLCLETLARGKKSVVSRGELVEIGGSFRIPDVMEKSGSMLSEVGTTNRTHLRDYENAIDPDTALLLKVHRSNYSIVGFTAEVPLRELAQLGSKHGIPVMEDLGSGTFVDFSQYGLAKEPTVAESVSAGADVVTFSGDKLLGGPQAGIIVGKKKYLDLVRKNPLTRALRIDKLTLAALESTLRLYRDPEKAARAIPTIRMMTLALSEIEKTAEKLKGMLGQINASGLHVEITDTVSRVGGGALPQQQLPTRCVGIRIDGKSANAIEKRMRNNSPPVIGRIEEGVFLMDPRTVSEDELAVICEAVESVAKD